MAGETPWPCTCVHGPTSSRHAVKSTVMSETSPSYDRRRSTHAAHWRRIDSAVCRRRAREHDSCSSIEGVTCRRGCEGHRVRFHSRAVDTHVPLYSHSRQELPEACSNSCHAQKAAQLEDGVIRCQMVKSRNGGTPLGNTSTLSWSTLMVKSPYRYKSHFSLRPCNLNRK